MTQTPSLSQPQWPSQRPPVIGAIRRLLRARVESDLLIYDGMGHGFKTHPDYPESQDLYQVAARFYDKQPAGVSSAVLSGGRSAC